MIKNYSNFIKENNQDVKDELYNFFYQNKKSIEERGLDFNNLKSDLKKILDSLSNDDVSQFLQSLKSLKGLSKEDFRDNFRDILIDMSSKIISNISESLLNDIYEFFQKIKNYIMDKIYLIYGLSMVSLGAYLTLSNQLSDMGINDADIKKWISGGVLFLGLIGLAYSNKK